MKIGIIGSGLVGSTAAYALVMRGIGREVVLVDKNMDRAQAEADDIFHAVPFAHPMNVSAGDYASLAGSRLVILTAGVNQQPGETRLQLLTRNASIFSDIVPRVLQHAPDAVLVVATNPVDVMTHLTARYASAFGVPSHRIFGSGTTLDTARFRTLLARYIGIDARHIHAYVIGEHGDSEVLAWSRVVVGGLPLEDYCRERHLILDDAIRQQIDSQVRRAAYHIIAGKGATYYGIGSALAQIANAVLGDQRSILTLTTPMAEVAGVQNVSVSLPRLVGGEGIIDTLSLSLSEAEHDGLCRSAQVIREAIDSVDAGASKN